MYYTMSSSLTQKLSFAKTPLFRGGANRISGLMPPLRLPCIVFRVASDDANDSSSSPVIGQR